MAAKKGSKKSSKMTAKKRKTLSQSSFALSGRRYPIDTPGRARNALARVSQFGTASEKAKVRSAVRRKYPSIAVGGKKSK